MAGCVVAPIGCGGGGGGIEIGGGFGVGTSICKDDAVVERFAGLGVRTNFSGPRNCFCGDRGGVLGLVERLDWDGLGEARRLLGESALSRGRLSLWVVAGGDLVRERRRSGCRRAGRGGDL